MAYDVEDFSKVIAGDIGLGLTHGPGRYTIPWGLTFIGDSSPFEHSALGVGDNVLVEAMPPRARVRSVQPDDTMLWFRLPMTDEQRDYCATQPYLDLQQGDIKYAWSAFLYMGFLRLGWRTEGLKNRVAKSRARICSQMTDKYVTDSGFHLIDGTDPGSVSPGDIGYRVSYDKSITCFRVDGKPTQSRLVREI